MSQFAISGAATGMDTASIVNQLVAVEGRQQQMLSGRQSAARKAADAYGTLITSLNALGTQAKALANTSAWVGSTTTSSSSSVTATATGSGNASLTFDVTRLAAAHSLISATSVSARTDVVASGPLTLTNSSGTSKTIEVGDGSLSSVASAINKADAGVTASIIQSGTGAYRLQVASKTTGEASDFSISGLSGFTGMNVLSQGSDASITVGTNPATAFTATSSTNTFTNIADGLSFTVGKLETGVTVTSAVDGTKVADDISKLVEATNSLLSNLEKQAASSLGGRNAGPLAGDSAVRQLTQRILSSVGGHNAPGISISREGQITFDRAAFNKAFQANPAAVADAFGASSTFTPSAGVTGSAEALRAGTSTRKGTYGVNVSASALRDTWQLDPPGALVAGRTIVVQRGSTTISYTAGPGETMADVSAALASRIARAGLGVGVSENAGGLKFTADSAGSGSAFTASIDSGTATHVTTGRDVAGTIDGQAAVGSGSTLTLSSGTGGAVGLSIKTNFTEADVAASGGAVGSVNYNPGLAQALQSVTSGATASVTGTLSAAKQSRLDSVSNLQKQIDAWTIRLDARRLSLTRQFTAMETAVASMKSQTSALSSM